MITDRRDAIAGAALLVLALGPGLPACGNGADGTDGGRAVSERTADERAGRAAGDSAPVDIHALERIPEVSVEDLDGTSHPIRELIRGPTVVNFWATWCAPCKRELPELAEVDEAIQDGGGRVLGIAVSSGTAGEIRSFAREHEVDFPLYRASQAWAGRHFGLYGVPTTLVVDGGGRVHERLMGPQTLESLMAHLRPLLEES